MRRFAIVSAIAFALVAAAAFTPDTADAAPTNCAAVPFDGGASAGVVLLPSKRFTYTVQCTDACRMNTVADAGATIDVNAFRPPVPGFYEFSSAGAPLVKVVGVDGGNPGATICQNAL